MVNPIKIKLACLSLAKFILYGLLVLAVNPINAQALLEVENIDQARIAVAYNLNFSEDTNDLDRVRHERMMLLIGDEISMFASYNKLHNDNLLKGLDERAGVAHVLVAATTGRSPTRFGGLHILKNFRNNRLINNNNMFNDWYIYEEPLNQINWELTDQKSEHLGNTVQKATARFGGRLWEAWFTSDIPVSDGPYKFNGLPGLILKIQDSEKHYVFSAESISVPEKERAIYRKKRQNYHVSRRQYLDIRQNKANIWTQRLTEWGNSPEMVKQLEQRMKSRNNPIQMRAE
jgi:GLPGLI family protein